MMQPSRFTRRLALAALACAGAAALAVGPVAIAQDAPPTAPARAEQAATVTVEDTTGKVHRLVSARIFAEAVGLLSVELEPTTEFSYMLGAGTVSIGEEEA